MSRDSASLLDIVRAGQLILQFAQGVSREQLEETLRRVLREELERIGK
jgi:hypothetical protein